MSLPCVGHRHMPLRSTTRGGPMPRPLPAHPPSCRRFHPGHARQAEPAPVCGACNIPGRGAGQWILHAHSFSLTYSQEKDKCCSRRATGCMLRYVHSSCFPLGPHLHPPSPVLWNPWQAAPHAGAAVVECESTMVVAGLGVAGMAVSCRTGAKNAGGRWDVFPVVLIPPRACCRLPSHSPSHNLCQL